MPRIARVVVPGLPHHPPSPAGYGVTGVSQRGNRQADVFFDRHDRKRYLSLLAKYGERHGVAIWAYCLMTNHVHFVGVPAAAASLGRTFRDAHQAYASWLNGKMGQSGHLWQGRFFSCVLDDRHLWAAVSRRAGMERNPVRAGLVARAEDWPWSSAGAHCGLRDDPLLSPIRMPWAVPDWSAYLCDEDEADTAAIRRQTRTGRPWGADAFIKTLESSLGRILHPRKRGRKPKSKKRSG